MRVLILCHADLLPPKKFIHLLSKKKVQHTKDNLIEDHKIEDQQWRTEAYVGRALCQAGHDIQFVGIRDNFKNIRKNISEYAPDVVFNLVEEFCDEAWLEGLVPEYLATQKVAYTGCSALGLLLAKNKQVAKVLLAAKKLQVPGNKKFPKIVKFASEESSLGLTQKSVVYTAKEEALRIRQLKVKHSSAVLSEEYIAGREFHIGVLPTPKGILISPPWETSFADLPGHHFLTEKLKWDFAFRIKNSVQLSEVTDLNKKELTALQDVAKKSVLALEIDGPARVDIRYTRQHRPYVIEVNPNPDLAEFDEYALCMKSTGLTYLQLIEMICQHAISR